LVFNGRGGGGGGISHNLNTHHVRTVLYVIYDHGRPHALARGARAHPGKS